MIGERFGQLVVLARDDRQAPGGQYYWRVRCDCGVEKSVRGSRLRNGGRGCECRCGLNGGIVGNKNRLTHGMTGTPLHRTWGSMKRRCLNPNVENYRLYGGRGINVCERWMRFEAFRDDMAATWQPGLTLERKDSNGDYTPENCRWATPLEQANNTRASKRIEARGATRTVAEWARFVGIPVSKIHNRLRRGWHPDLAIFGKCRPQEMFA